MRIPYAIPTAELARMVDGTIASAGHTAIPCPSLAAALQAQAELVFAEWPLGPAQIDFAEELKARDASVPVVVLVSSGGIAAMQRAIAAGATDVLACPIDLREIEAEIAEVGASGNVLPPDLRAEFERLRRTTLIGESTVFLRSLDEMKQAARCDANVLLLGETGTGKELVARAIHRLSQRNQSPYVALNCGSGPEGLTESELFGHAKGAFTGADDNRVGRFEEVGAGTLLLDEIGEMRIEQQVKLLRVIEAREFSRVGENRTIPFHGRLVCATSRDLDGMVAQGRFRPDLLGRIRQFRILLPPLRQRPGDIPILVWHFLDKHSRDRSVEISTSAMGLLANCKFPMNVRQLENAIIAALTRSAPATLILPRHLPKEIASTEPENAAPTTIQIPDDMPYVEAREQVCRAFDRATLVPLFHKCNRNLSQTAREAGIDRKTLAARLPESEKEEGNEQD